MTSRFRLNCVKIRLISLFVLLLFGAFRGNAQLMELGMHVGYSFTKLTVSENKLNDQVFVKSGRPIGAPIFGAQFMIGPPKGQSSPSLKIIPSILFEASLCRCGGNIELSLTDTSGLRSLRELQYVIYRGDYSMKFIANIRKMQLMLGPTVSNRFYTGVRVGGSEKLTTANEQFKTLAIGYEFGIGTKLNKIHLSARYNGLFGAYGKETDAIPTSYKNFQLRFMIHYYFLSKHKGQYWDSIYWE